MRMKTKADRLSLAAIVLCILGTLSAQDPDVVKVWSLCGWIFVLVWFLGGRATRHDIDAR